MVWKTYAAMAGGGLAVGAAIGIVGFGLLETAGPASIRPASERLVSPVAELAPMLQPVGLSEPSAPGKAAPAPAAAGAAAWKSALKALGIEAEKVEAGPGHLILSGLSRAKENGDRVRVARVEIQELEPTAIAALLGSYDGVLARRIVFSGIVAEKGDGSRFDARELAFDRPYLRTGRSGGRAVRARAVGLSGVKIVEKGKHVGTIGTVRIANTGFELPGDGGKGAILISQDPANPPSVRIENFSAPARDAGPGQIDFWRDVMGHDEMKGSVSVSYVPQAGDETVRDLQVAVDLTGMATLDVTASIAPRRKSEGEWLRIPMGKKDKEVPDVMFHGLSLNYHDHSLMPHILDYMGRERGVSGEEAAQELSSMAALLTMAAGNEGAAKLEPLTRSLGEFLREPGRLSLAIEPVSPIALAELSGGEGVKPELLRRLRIKASASPR